MYIRMMLAAIAAVSVIVLLIAVALPQQHVIYYTNNQIWIDDQCYIDESNVTWCREGNI